MMKQRYFLGVDGGNTKTDFFLFREDGALAAQLRTGTCSHEALQGSYEAAGRALGEALEALCGQAGMKLEETGSAVLGLAGVDIPAQYEAMTKVIASLGIPHFYLCNDSMLGIKAMTSAGCGICCVNGTGTSVSGVDPSGRVCQVGGIGDLTSDYAGGGFLAREVLRAVYNQYCRDGEETALTPPVSSLLGIADASAILDVIHGDHLQVKTVERELDELLFSCAQEGDAVSAAIIEKMSRNLSASVAGCYKLLSFGVRSVEIVLAGSIWVKSGYPPLAEEFRRDVEKRIAARIKLLLLEAPPVLGAVLWAFERAEVPSSLQLREKVLEQILSVRF